MIQAFLGNQSAHVFDASTSVQQFLRRGGTVLLLLLAVGAATLGAPAFAGDPVVVNINTAGPEELSEGLSGIGLAKAYRIVEYREAHGPFEAVEELAEVRGIGANTVEKNREAITLQ